MTIAVLLLLAGLLPYVAAVAAKAGGQGFDNASPRAWLARQEGWRARANAAQSNAFEALPLFFAVVLFALYRGVPEPVVAQAMLIWVLLRLVYLGCYLANRASLRSLVWALALIDVLVLLWRAGSAG